MAQLDRITQHPDVMGGKRDDIMQALRYAAWRAEEHEITLNTE